MHLLHLVLTGGCDELENFLDWQFQLMVHLILLNRLICCFVQRGHSPSPALGRSICISCLWLWLGDVITCRIFFTVNFIWWCIWYYWMNHRSIGWFFREAFLLALPLEEIDASLASGSDWGMCSLGEFYFVGISIDGASDLTEQLDWLLCAARHFS